MVLVFDESGTLVERLLHGPQVDQVLAGEDASGDVQWFLGDHLGTIRDVVEYDSGTDTTTVVNHLQYSSVGQITSQTSSTDETRPVEKGDRHAECCLRLIMATAEAASQSPFSTTRYAFTGREWDADADLYYYRARWYDPTAGRLISEDPIGFAAGDVNVQRCVGNSVTGYGDATGLDGGLDDDQFHYYFHFEYDGFDVWLEFNGMNTSTANPGGYFVGAPGYVTITTRPLGASTDPLDIPGGPEDAENVIQFVEQHTEGGNIREIIEEQICELTADPLTARPSQVDGCSSLETYGLLWSDCHSFAKACAAEYIWGPTPDVPFYIDAGTHGPSAPAPPLPPDRDGIPSEAWETIPFGTAF